MGKLKMLRSATTAPAGQKAQPLPGSVAFADPARGSATSRGYGWAWQKLRARILARDGHRCRCDECSASGAIYPAHEVDHRIPKAMGGTDDPSNLVAIHREHHRRKSQAEAVAARQAGRG